MSVTKKSDLPVSDQFILQSSPKTGLKQITFVYIAPKACLKQGNHIFPLQNSQFSHRSPKKVFFSVPHSRYRVIQKKR